MFFLLDDLIPMCYSDTIFGGYKMSEKKAMTYAEKRKETVRNLVRKMDRLEGVIVTSEGRILYKPQFKKKVVREINEQKRKNGEWGAVARVQKKYNDMGLPLIRRTLDFWKLKYGN